MSEEKDNKQEEVGGSPTSSAFSFIPGWLILVIGIIIVAIVLVFLFRGVSGGVENAPDIPSVEI